jgi:twinkle protein
VALLARLLRLEGRCAMPLNQPDYIADFFNARHIGQKTLDHFMITGGVQTFEGKRQQAIEFPYIFQGKIVGRKYRSVIGKKFTQTASKPATVYNADAIDLDVTYWVEGESDVLAMHESGYRNTVSLRDGAQGFGSLDAHKEILAKVKCHILAGDMDEAGLKWRTEAARRFGRHKCKFVTWPEGCKDAGEVLQNYDDRTEAVRRCVEAAQSFPVEGILELPSVNDLLDAPPPPVMTTGTIASDNILRLPADGRLIVLTGRYEQGKSTWMKYIMAHTARHHDRKWLTFAGEDDPDTFWRDMIRAALAKARRDITQEDRLWVATFLRTRVRLVEISEAQPATLASLLERAEVSVLAHGTTDFLVDPWNEIEYDRGGASMTDYIGNCLKDAKRFAHNHGCNVWFNTHPPKVRMEDRDARLTGYDIADSANWGNKADLGLSLRILKDTGQTELFVWKSKRRRWARSSRQCKMDFNQETGVYQDPIAAADDIPPNDNRWGDC